MGGSKAATTVAPAVARKGGRGESSRSSSGGSCLSIWLLVEHRVEGMIHSLYKIDVPSDLKSQQQQPDEDEDDDNYEDWPCLDHPVSSPSGSKSDYCYCYNNNNYYSKKKRSNYLWPSSTILFPGRRLLTNPEMVSLGGKIYILGGISCGATKLVSDKVYSRLLTAVHVVEEGKDGNSKVKTVKPMNYPKHNACMFVDDGKIYALGSAVDEDNSLRYYKLRGCFERYHPDLDRWEVLPDPPLPSYFNPEISEWSEHATIIGRKVFVAAEHIRDSHLFVFNLDTLQWEQHDHVVNNNKNSPPPSYDFPYGALFVDDYLYHIRGGFEYWRISKVFDRRHENGPLEIVKRGPFSSTDGGGGGGPLEKCQTVATVSDMESEKQTFFTHTNFLPWRKLFHLGGPFFCLLITSQNIDWEDKSLIDYHGRGVFIKIFKQVVVDDDTSKFRLFASFCYKFRTPFRNFGHHVRCCVVGSVPASWYEVPLKEKQESETRTNRSVIKSVGKTNGGYDNNNSDGSFNELSKMTALERRLEAWEDSLVARESQLVMKEKQVNKKACPKCLSSK